MSGPALGELWHDGVAALILIDDSVNRRGRGGLHLRDEVVDPVGVHGNAQSKLCLDLVPIGHRHVAHVVAEADEPEPT